jgi:hypothetical protein
MANDRSQVKRRAASCDSTSTRRGPMDAASTFCTSQSVAVKRRWWRAKSVRGAQPPIGSTYLGEAQIFWPGIWRARRARDWRPRSRSTVRRGVGPPAGLLAGRWQGAGRRWQGAGRALAGHWQGTGRALAGPAGSWWPGPQGRGGLAGRPRPAAGRDGRVAAASDAASRPAGEARPALQLPDPSRR